MKSMEERKRLPVRPILWPLSSTEVNKVVLSTGKKEIPWDLRSFTASHDVADRAAKISSYKASYSEHTTDGRRILGYVIIILKMDYVCLLSIFPMHLPRAMCGSISECHLWCFCCSRCAP